MTYRRRYRRSPTFGRALSRWWRRRTPLQQLAIALAVLVVMFGAAGAQHADSAPSPSSAAVTAAGGPGAAQWAVAFLSRIPEPVTSCNEAAIEAWEDEEGGGVTNTATYNPLNTTQTEPGSYPIPDNSAGVQAFPSRSEGLQANVIAITNGLYGPILSALDAGDNAQAVADAVASSDWGTAGFSASC